MCRHVCVEMRRIPHFCHRFASQPTLVSFFLVIYHRYSDCSLKTDATEQSSCLQMLVSSRECNNYYAKTVIFDLFDTQISVRSVRFVLSKERQLAQL